MGPAYFAEHLPKCRANSNLDRPDCVSALGLSKVQKQRGQETTGTDPFGPNHAPGAHGPGGDDWSPPTRLSSTFIIQLA